MRDKLLTFVVGHRGAIIGAIIGILLYIFGLTRFLLLAFLIILGMIVGNTIEKNRVDIKESLKRFIDKV